VFGSPFYPVTNWLCLAFLAGILVIMFLTPEMRMSVYLIPVWLVVLGVGYRTRQRRETVIA
jgi:L-asparagine transporter-like permease